MGGNKLMCAVNGSGLPGKFLLHPREQMFARQDLRTVPLLPNEQHKMKSNQLDRTNEEYYPNLAYFELDVAVSLFRFSDIITFIY